MPSTTLLGIISDTHGLLRPEALAVLEGCGHIIHAGDIGRPEILDRLAEIAPITAIRGNVDTAPWAAAIPESLTVAIAGVRFHVVHDVHDLAVDPAAEGIEIVVSGHSHKPAVRTQSGILFLNPGSAGRRRFRLPVTLATLDPSVRPFKLVFYDLELPGRTLSI